MSQTTERVTEQTTKPRSTADILAELLDAKRVHLATVREYDRVSEEEYRLREAKEESRRVSDALQVELSRAIEAEAAR